jgi:hypothetical protein
MHVFTYFGLLGSADFSHVSNTVCMPGLAPAELVSYIVLKSKGEASALRLLLAAHNTSSNDVLAS